MDSSRVSCNSISFGSHSLPVRSSSVSYFSSSIVGGDKGDELGKDPHRSRLVPKASLALGSDTPRDHRQYRNVGLPACGVGLDDIRDWRPDEGPERNRTPHRTSV